MKAQSTTTTRIHHLNFHRGTGLEKEGIPPIKKDNKVDLIISMKNVNLVVFVKTKFFLNYKCVII